MEIKEEEFIISNPINFVTCSYQFITASIEGIFKVKLV